MPQPLVLRLGRIAEEIPAEAGTYPLLRLVDGRLVAGGSGINLYLSGGRISQVASTGLYVDTDYSDDYADAAPESYLVADYTAEGYVV